MKIQKVGSNMTELYDNLTGTVLFFSYETPVSAILPSGRIVKTDEYYSRTTTKHINKWIGNRKNVEVVSQSFINNLFYDEASEQVEQVKANIRSIRY